MKNWLTVFKKIDLCGSKFNKWTVLSLDSVRHKVYYYLCRCECGTEKAVRGTHLSAGTSKSCGCLSKFSHDPRLASANKVYINHYNDGDLSFEEFISLSQNVCYYCGSPPSNVYDRYKSRNTISAPFSYNGLDRLDPSLSHNKNNVVPCCAVCNYAKTDMKFEEFKSWVEKVYNHCCKREELTNSQI